MRWLSAAASALAGLAALLVARRVSDGGSSTNENGTADLDAIPFIPAKHYQAGGLSKTPSLIVIHATLNPTRAGIARNVAAYFQNPPTPASAHFIVDPGETIQCVKLTDEAWHARGVNDRAIGVELTAYASASEPWHDAPHQAMLDRAASLVAALCERQGIPVRFLDAEGLKDPAARGITTHAEVTNAFHQTDHSDPGPAFPMSEFLQAVLAKTGVS